MELYVFDPAQQLGVVDSADSVRWRRKFFEPGEVEIHLPATAEHVLLMREGHVLRRTDRVEAAIITGIAISGEDLTVSGRMLSSILGRAILSQTYNLSGAYESAMLELIQEGTRVFPLLQAGVPHGYPERMERMQATWKNLLTVEERLARASGLGFRVRFAPGEAWTFECVRGTDHSVTQTEHPHVIFSEEFRNLVDPAYTRDSTSYRNVAFVGGEGEGAARRVILVDQSGGGERRELWVDAKDIQREELTDQEYDDALTQRGVEKLAECVAVENFEAAGENVPNFEYLIDWDLGDLVTAQYQRLGITFTARVTEVEEVYENGVETITPVLGDPLSEKLEIGAD